MLKVCFGYSIGCISLHLVNINNKPLTSYNKTGNGRHSLTVSLLCQHRGKGSIV